MSSNRFTRLGRATRLLALSAAMLSLPAHALYKVVGPDGKVTYTDRIPSQTEGKVTPLNPSGNTVPDSEPALPLELRQATARYPVTLYVIADCAPCDNARALLRQRGIPHTEKLVLTEADAVALQRLTGARDAPVLMIGQEPLRGLSTATWNTYLDAAGYPRESRLPAGYQHAAATPLTERRDTTRTAPLATPPAPLVQPSQPEAASPTPAIRF